MSVSVIFKTPLLNLYIEADGEGISLLRPATCRDRAEGTSAVLNMAEAWLEAYFSKSMVLPPLPPFSLHATPFRLKVWNSLLNIPYGKTVTYGDIARRIGCASARAVGNAVSSNPVLIMIPCHRVVSAGGIGGYVYGVELKRILLRLENESNN